MTTQETEKHCSSQVGASSSISALNSHQVDSCTTQTESINLPRYILRSRKRKASPVTSHEPIQKRSRTDPEQPTGPSKSPLATRGHNSRPGRAPRTKRHPHEPTDEHLEGEAESFRQKIKAVMRKVDKKHSESFKLRKLRRQIWDTIEECDTSIVVDQRHIVGLNHGDRDHFLGHLNSVDRKLQKTYDKMDNIQNALDDNHAKVDELLDEHEGLLKELARIEKTIRDRVIRAKDL